MGRSAAKPRYLQVREKIKRSIETGKFLPGSKLPPEAVLFKQLDASNTTVVRALNDLVREGLIVRRRGSGTYVAERQHPPLIAGRVLKLGILWYHTVHPDLWRSFCYRLSAGAMRAWGMVDVEPKLDADRAQTYSRATWSQPSRGLTVECMGHEWAGEHRAPSLKIVREAGYDGVLTLGIVEENWLQELMTLNLPAVIVDFPTQRFATQADLVYADPQNGYRSAVDHFLAQGLQRIHFVSTLIGDPHVRIPDSGFRAGYRLGKRTDPDSFLRLSAWRQAMEANGIVHNESWVHSQAAGDTELAKTLAELPPSERPEALICHSADQAANLIEQCAAYGLRVEAAGASDRTILGRVRNIRFDAEQMGAVAGELLLMRLKEPTRPFLNVGVRMVFEPTPNQAG